VTKFTAELASFWRFCAIAHYTSIEYWSNNVSIFTVLERYKTTSIGLIIYSLRDSVFQAKVAQLIIVLRCFVFKCFILKIPCLWSSYCSCHTSTDTIGWPTEGRLPTSKTRYRPGAARRYAPADGSSTVANTAADLRPSADGSAIRTSLVASVPIA